MTCQRATKYTNQYRTVGDDAWVDVVRKGDGVTVGSFVVDAVDLPAVKKYRWHFGAGRPAYPATVISGNSVRLHQIILGKFYDHIDRNRMNNRRSNLRIATHAQNMMNTGPRRRNKYRETPSSSYKGVHWCKTERKWKACLRRDGRNLLQERFDTEIEAAQAYDAAVREHCPEFGFLNFPEGAATVAGIAVRAATRP